MLLGCSWGVLGVHLGPLEISSDALKSPMGYFQPRLLAFLVPSRGSLGLSWGRLVASWDYLGTPGDFSLGTPADFVCSLWVLLSPSLGAVGPFPV
jgi:hypothetical protein